MSYNRIHDNNPKARENNCGCEQYSIFTRIFHAASTQNRAGARFVVWDIGRFQSSVICTDCSAPVQLIELSGKTTTFMLLNAVNAECFASP
jgi:hypothetical protein